MRMAIIWLTTALTFVAVDALWLWFAGPALYRPVLGAHMKETLDVAPAVAFYLIYTVALVALIFGFRSPASAWEAAMMAAVFGLAAYATYDLSNQATLKFWDWKLAILDIAWGTIATATAAFAGAKIAMVWP